MTSREVADVHRNPAERHHGKALTFCEEPIGDATLIEYLDGASVQPSGS